MHLRATGVRFTFLLALLIPALLMGQDVATGGGTITGRVTDATGAIVADATVTITDTSTNIGITVTSNVSGLYILQSVKPGVYNIAATKPGFRKSVVPTQEVTAGSSLTLNFALEVGAVTETVQVQASAEAELQTLNSTMGQTLTGTSILNLPTANRDVSSLLFVQPTASRPSVGRKATSPAALSRATPAIRTLTCWMAATTPATWTATTARTSAAVPALPRPSNVER